MAYGRRKRKSSSVASRVAKRRRVGRRVSSGFRSQPIASGSSSRSGMARRRRRFGQRFNRRTLQRALGRRTRSVRGARYVKGRIGPRMRAVQSTRKDIVNIKGSRANIEQGGVLSVITSTSAYVGHGVAAKQVALAACRAIVKELYRQKGENIVRWFDSPKTSPSTFQLSYWYYTSEADAAPTQVNLAIDGTTTYYVVAENLFTSFNANLSLGARISYIWFNDKNFQGGTEYGQTTASIDPDCFNLNYYITSTIMIQNCSKGGTTGGETADDDLVTEVTKNPLVGKVYKSTKWSNGFYPKARPQANDGSWTGFIADNTYGYIAANGVNNASPDLVKPPPGYWFDGAKSSGCTLAPGEIRYLKWKFRTTIGCGNFWKRYVTWTNGTTVGFPFGPCEMIGLEKMIDCRAGEHNIELHYQINQHYGCFGRSSNKPSATINVIGS